MDLIAVQYLETNSGLPRNNQQLISISKVKQSKPITYGKHMQCNKSDVSQRSLRKSTIRIVKFSSALSRDIMTTCLYVETGTF
jgi:hypothetical protein